jgi:ACS family hexuronate transporter-like MFS transporter
MMCALLFFATTINYTDRQVLGLLAPMLQTKIGWNEAQYAYIGTSFSMAYALGLLIMGGLIDRVGTRLGYAAIAIWSLAAVSHSLVGSARGSGSSGLRSSSASPEIFPRQSRRLPSGFRKKNERWQRGSLTRARMQAPQSPLLSYPGLQPLSEKVKQLLCDG